MGPVGRKFSSAKKIREVLTQWVGVILGPILRGLEWVLCSAKNIRVKNNNEVLTDSAW